MLASFFWVKANFAFLQASPSCLSALQSKNCHSFTFSSKASTSRSSGSEPSLT